MLQRFITIALGLLLLSSPALGNTNSVEGLQASAQNLAQQLRQQLLNQENQYPIALTSFVQAGSLTEFDHLDPNQRVANALHEGMFTELKQQGLDVSDIRGRDYLEVNEAGVFNLSNDVEKLQNHRPLDWILVGTLVPREHGIMANVRVLDRRSQQVLAAAEEYIPERLYWPQRQVRWNGRVIERTSIKGAK